MTNAGAFPTAARCRYLILVPILAASFLLGPLAKASQDNPDSNNPFAQELRKFPDLIPALGRLFEQYAKSSTLPGPRSESRLLPLLPESTMYYASLSNYGDVVHQAHTILRRQLQEDPQLRNWWEHGSFAEAGPKALDLLDKLDQLLQHFGNEIVIAGSVNKQKPNFLILAEARKPGLKQFLEQLALDSARSTKLSFRVLDPQELATAKTQNNDLLFLVRPDLILAASDLPTLRSANSALDHHSSQFAATAFGRRIAQEYQGGITFAAAADLQKLFAQLPSGSRQDPTFHRSGFADLQYFTWRHNATGAQASSETELTFTAPRHGVASWLAKPGPVNSLDFVSPKAILTLAMLLVSPAQIFDDVRRLSAPPNSEPPSMAPVEKALNISLQDDLLNLLTGELALEVDEIDVNKPAGRLILGVRDADHLQRTLTTLLHLAPFQMQDDAGTPTLHTIRIPNPKTPMDITWAFLDGYLVIGTGRDSVAESLRLHASGESLAKSPRFQAPSASGQALKASALILQDPTSMAALQLRRFMPGLAASLPTLSGALPPTIVSVYASDTSIRQTSNNGAFDVAGALVVAAVAIPNLIKSKVAANEASAVGCLRTVNTAQATYATIYPKRGYAPNLATLGPGPDSTKSATDSPEHAELLDSTLGGAACTGSAWCTKSGYQFRISGVCKLKNCSDYIAVAIPLDSNTGTRSFCTTSDAIIRLTPEQVPNSSFTVAQCKSWQPLQ